MFTLASPFVDPGNSQGSFVHLVHGRTWHAEPLPRHASRHGSNLDKLKVPARCTMVPFNRLESAECRGMEETARLIGFCFRVYLGRTCGPGDPHGLLLAGVDFFFDTALQRQQWVVRHTTVGSMACQVGATRDESCTPMCLHPLCLPPDASLAAEWRYCSPCSLDPARKCLAKVTCSRDNQQPNAQHHQCHRPNSSQPLPTSPKGLRVRWSLVRIGAQRDRQTRASTRS